MSSVPSVVASAPQFKGYPYSNLIWWGAVWLAALAAATLTIIAALNYPGQRWAFAIFVALSFFMIALVVPKPRLYGYTFFAAFLFLGFCAKTVAYFGLRIALVEPTGNFNGTGAAWDAALAVAIAGSASVVSVRVIHLIGSRVTGGRAQPSDPIGHYPPGWYVRRRLGVVAVSIMAIIALDALNLVTALYQVGVSPRLVLPAHLNGVVSWLITTGLALWTATLFGWEVRLYPQNGGRRLLIPLVEAIGTMSTLSRAAYLFRALPYVAVLAEHRNFYQRAFSRRWRWTWLLVLPAGFVLSLIAVSAFRVAIFPSAPSEIPTASVVMTPSPVASPTTAPTPSAATTPPLPATQPFDRVNSRLGWAAREISTMVVGRWIGIEGAMAVSSYRGLGLGLLGQGLLENPRTGEAALYQRISRSSYNTSGQFVFLTTPGAVAILYYAGSLPLVALGMAVLTGVLLTFEILASRILVNSFVVAVLSLTLANAIAQADFPYLLLVAFLEQAAAVIAFGILLRMSGGARVVAPEPGNERVGKGARW
jgi:hypothetical protein